MRKITGIAGTMSFIGLFAFLMVLTYASNAGARHGGAMMTGPCATCGKGPGMMSMMGGPTPGAKHPSGAGLMKMLHQWAKHLFSESDQLGITEKQMDEIESLLMSHIKYAMRKKADVKIALFEIQELLVKENINLKAVENKIKAMEGLNTDMAIEGVETLEKALAVLTPEQQKQIRSLFKKSIFMRMGMMPGGMMKGVEQGASRGEVEKERADKQ